jgi:hypothetical protein
MRALMQTCIGRPTGNIQILNFKLHLFTSEYLHVSRSFHAATAPTFAHVFRQGKILTVSNITRLACVPYR